MGRAALPLFSSLLLNDSDYLQVVYLYKVEKVTFLGGKGDLSCVCEVLSLPSEVQTTVLFVHPPTQYFPPPYIKPSNILNCATQMLTFSQACLLSLAVTHTS